MRIKSKMLDIIEIKPQQGLSNLFFGATMKEVEDILGEAEEVEKLKEENGFDTVIWHYWEKGYSLFFNSEKNNVFTCVEIDNNGALLWGNEVFKMTEKEIIDLFKRKGFKNMDTEEQEWGEKRISFEDALVDCYFENGNLISINYGIYIEDTRVLILPN